MMVGMRRRVLMWAGTGVTVVALAGLGVYFGVVGLEKADMLASVIGVFIAVAGLAVAVYALSGNRRDTGTGDRPQRPGSAGGDDAGIVSAGDGATNVHLRAEASGEGRVYQAGRDQTITER
jgi:hypothetical protein